MTGAAAITKTNNRWYLLLILLVVADICLTVYLIYLHLKEPFCNCFASQYDGSEGDPNHRSYYGGYCYDKEKITRQYEEGVYAPGV